MIKINIILFTPSNISYQYYRKYINERILFVKYLSQKNININVTDMARSPNNTLFMIKEYLNAGIKPEKIICHVAAQARTRYQTDIFLDNLKTLNINNILCINGDITGIPKDKRIKNTYDVYDLIKITKNLFNISISAYPENLYNLNINENKYLAIEQQDSINNKLQLLSNNKVNVFLQHSYNKTHVENMVSYIQKISNQYNVKTNIYPAILPLFSPKYVTKLSGRYAVNDNKINIPDKYFNIINNAISNNRSKEIELYNSELLNETILLMNDIRIISDQNISIYKTENDKLMKDLINKIINK